MSTILVVDETGTLHLPPSVLPHPQPGQRYQVAVEKGLVVLKEENDSPDPQEDREDWLNELDTLRERWTTGVTGPPAQEVWDDLRNETVQ